MINKMRIAIVSDKEGWLKKEYINSPIVTRVKNKQVVFGTSITENKSCEIRAVILWMPYISFLRIVHDYTTNSIPAL